MKEIPDVILNPPEKYDKIVNKKGICGSKPNLYYNGTPHRIWVLHVVNGVEARNGIEDYITDFATDGNEDKMREAVQQALDFYKEYTEEFKVVEERRQKQLEKIKSNSKQK